MNEERAQESVAIVGYSDEHADAFARLNREWLERHDLLEEGDLAHLYHPRESILAGGGEIFLAMAGSEVVGTCAAIVCDRETIELAKLSVAEGMRGRGIGRMLTEAVLEWASERGVRKVVLVSSTKLTTALRLYERLGFEYGPMPADPGYATADVYMELELRRPLLEQVLSMKLEIKPEAGFLRVGAAGEFSLKAAKRTFLEMLEAVVRHQVKKVLFDGRGLVGEPGIMERFYYGEFAARAVNESADRGMISRSTQFAYVLEEPVLDPRRLGEDVAVNRGMFVKAFDNLEGALAWLGVLSADNSDAVDRN